MIKLMIAGFPGCHVQITEDIFTLVFFIRILEAVPVEQRNQVKLDITLKMRELRLPPQVVLSRCNLEKETGKLSYLGRILFVWRGPFPSLGDLRKIKILMKYSRQYVKNARNIMQHSPDALDQQLPET